MMTPLMSGATAEASATLMDDGELEQRLDDGDGEIRSNGGFFLCFRKVF